MRLLLDGRIGSKVSVGLEVAEALHAYSPVKLVLTYDLANA